MKREMKLLIHSLTSTVQPLKFGIESVISSHTLYWMQLLMLKINQTSQRHIGDKTTEKQAKSRHA